MTLRKKFTAFVAVAFIFALFAATALAADEKSKPAEPPKGSNETTLTVGSESLNANEVIGVLHESAGGNPMMVGLMLTQTTLADRRELVSQMADAMLFAEGARLEGIDKREDVQLKLKWQRIQILLEAYFQDISKKWDFSDDAMKKYYDEHKDEFVQASAQHIRHILTGSEKEARNAILDIYRNKDFAKTAEKFSRDQNTAAKGGDLGWIEDGTMPDSLAKATKESNLNSLAGPVETEVGWHVFEVLERRPEKQLTYEEARGEVIQRMQMNYVALELEKLRAKVKIEINDKALENLGGIPAAPMQKTPDAPKDLKPVEESPK